MAKGHTFLRIEIGTLQLRWSAVFIKYYLMYRESQTSSSSNLLVGYKATAKHCSIHHHDIMAKSGPWRWIVTIPLFDQRLATIENHWKPLGAMVGGPKTTVKPLGPMVGGVIEKQSLPFHRLTIGYHRTKFKNHRTQWYMEKTIDHSIVLKNSIASQIPPGWVFGGSL